MEEQPISPAEFRKEWIFIHREKGLKILENMVEMEKANLVACVEYSKIAINGAFLLNGSAAVAILYNTKYLQNVWLDAVFWCALGALFSVLSAGLSYIAQRFYADASLKNSIHEVQYFYSAVLDVVSYNEIRSQPSPRISFCVGNIFSIIACLVFLISIIMFLCSIFRVLDYAEFISI